MLCAHSQGLIFQGDKSSVFCCLQVRKGENVSLLQETECSWAHGNYQGLYQGTGLWHPEWSRAPAAGGKESGVLFTPACAPGEPWLPPVSHLLSLPRPFQLVPARFQGTARSPHKFLLTSLCWRSTPPSSDLSPEIYSRQRKGLSQRRPTKAGVSGTIAGRCGNVLSTMGHGDFKSHLSLTIRQGMCPGFEGCIVYDHSYRFHATYDKK